MVGSRSTRLAESMAVMRSQIGVVPGPAPPRLGSRLTGMQQRVLTFVTVGEMVQWMELRHSTRREPPLIVSQVAHV